MFWLWFFMALIGEVGLLSGAFGPAVVGDIVVAADVAYSPFVVAGSLPLWIAWLVVSIAMLGFGVAGIDRESRRYRERTRAHEDGAETSRDKPVTTGRRAA